MLKIGVKRYEPASQANLGLVIGLPGLIKTHGVLKAPFDIIAPTDKIKIVLI